jgi:hypothetical protein
VRNLGSLAARIEKRKGRERRGGRGGLIGEVLMDIYTQEINGGVTPVIVSETGRGRGDCGEDEDDRWVSGGWEREEGCAGLGWSGTIWAGWVPGTAQVGLLSFLFFSSVFFCF